MALFVLGPCVVGAAAHAVAELSGFEFSSPSTQRQVVGAGAALSLGVLIVLHQLVIRRRWGRE